MATAKSRFDFNWFAHKNLDVQENPFVCVGWFAEGKGSSFQFWQQHGWRLVEWPNGFEVHLLPFSSFIGWLDRKIIDGNIKSRHTHHNMNDIEKLIHALNHASILIVNGYTLTSWEVEEIENLEDDDVALNFGYTDSEGLIFEFEFTLESLKNATINANEVKAVDVVGENVVFELYSMQKYVIWRKTALTL